MRKAALFMATVGVMIWAVVAASPVAASPVAASPPRLLRSDVSADFVTWPATISVGCCGQLVVGGPDETRAAFRAGRLGGIRWRSAAPADSVGVGRLWEDGCVPNCRSGAVRSWRVFIRAYRSVGSRYTRLLLLYRSGGRQVYDRLKLERVTGLKKTAYQWTRGRLPGASTGPASLITQNSATVSATVNSKERATTYSFQYGTTASYGSITAGQAAGSGATAVSVSANLSGLVSGVTYHYRIRAISASGVAYGADRTFTAFITPQQSDANRAVATYNAMQTDFSAASVYPGDTSGLYTGSYPRTATRYSGLWPFSQALAGIVTLAGIPSDLLGGVSYRADVDDALTGLSGYFDSTSSPPGYDGRPTGRFGSGGDKYYDDQAWVGLATAEDYAMTGDPTALADAENVFNFVYPGGWAGGASFDPGGIYWVQQGVGEGLSNHDRTTTSNAPNAELAALLATLDPSNAPTYQAGANAIYAWVNHNLYNVDTNPTDPETPNPNFTPSQPALMFDRISGANVVVPTLYTYNQGAMIAANVREYQATGNSAYLTDAEAIATESLSTFNEDYYINHSAAFNAIFFRGLLVLSSVTSNPSLQTSIIQTIQTYADDAWDHHRSSNGLFSFASKSGPGDQLIDQGAMLQIFAMLAWNPSQYGELP